MGARFLHELRGAVRPAAEGEPPLGPFELEFLAERDSFYLATVTSEGWPYVQHRGGPKGFLKAIGPSTLAFADLKGNRQLITTGNLSGGARVALIAVDYPRRERLKLLGHARVETVAAHPELAAKHAERVMVIDVIASDWNCPAYITPRYTVAEVEQLARPLRERVAQLEAELKSLRSP
jgi:predicted pyridoxine 5'-phosphate oxidase superfamily flavin-nucleotide-binding protein